MVTPGDIARARSVAGAVEDPELPPITIADLGVLRGVEADGTRLVARITPTYSGCPANAVIALAVDTALREAGFDDIEVRTEWAPAWSTSDISATGRAKLAEMGIAPPVADPEAAPNCPRCGAAATTEISRFGATACKSLWRCRACAEPFEAFKTL